MLPSARRFRDEDPLPERVLNQVLVGVSTRGYGANFEPPAVVEPLKALVFGRKGNLVTVDGLLNRLKLFCTIYDPANERYRFDYSIFVGGTIGLVSLILLAGISIREWRRGRFARGNA